MDNVCSSCCGEGVGGAIVVLLLLLLVLLAHGLFIKGEEAEAVVVVVFIIPHPWDEAGDLVDAEAVGRFEVLPHGFGMAAPAAPAC